MRFEGLNIYTGEYAAIETGGGLISRIEKAETPPDGLSRTVLARGFVDIQVNGYQGLDYSGSDLTAEQIMDLITLLAQAGTLRHMPTVITGSYEKTRASPAALSYTLNSKARCLPICFSSSIS